MEAELFTFNGVEFVLLFGVDLGFLYSLFMVLFLFWFLFVVFFSLNLSVLYLK